MLPSDDEPMHAVSTADRLNINYDSDDSSMQVDSDSPQNNISVHEHDGDGDADADIDAEGESIHVSSHSSPGAGLGPSVSSTAGPSSYAQRDSVRTSLARAPCIVINSWSWSQDEDDSVCHFKKKFFHYLILAHRVTMTMPTREMKTKTTVPTPTKSIARRSRRKRNSLLPFPNPVVSLLVHPTPTPTLTRAAPVAVPSRNSPSDSDSEYGSRSKKKKRSHLPGDEIRVSSRGGKIPNYFDDVADFEKFDSDEAGPNYYVDPNTQYKEEDEIEAVLTHQRDEDRLDDPEDQWFDNIVRRHLMDDVRDGILMTVWCSASTSSGRISPTYTTQMRPTNSSNASKASNA